MRRIVGAESNSSIERTASPSNTPPTNGHVAGLPQVSPEPEAVAEPVLSDFPAPRSLAAVDELVWNEDRPAIENYVAVGAKLAECGDLFRSSIHASGLMFAPQLPRIAPAPITKASDLAPLIADRLRIRVIKDGKLRGWRLPRAHLEIMLRSEAFLQQFQPLDLVTRTSIYLPDFRLTAPGHNDGGIGHRVFYCGEPAPVEASRETLTQFLDAMSFATPADRTNAVAAALTVMLRNHFLGAKPMISVTANKSHAGKGTIVAFAAGMNRITAISYEEADWALQRSFTGAVNHNSDTAVINVDNARVSQRASFIRSAFLERFLTDPEPTLFSTGTGAPRRIKNHLVVAITTNFGTLSEDLANRALPIHLEAIGNVADRRLRIGNPKLEFLPANQNRIEAELRGMIEIWKAAGSPTDTAVRHPSTQWAATVGGILKANGFDEFLANYSMRRTVDDPISHALSLIGAAQPNKWCRAAEWAQLAVDLGLVSVLIPSMERSTDKGRERGMGVVLSAHRDEVFRAETDDERLALQLERQRRRFDSGLPTTRYRFTALQRESIPEDEPRDDCAAIGDMAQANLS